MRRRLRSNPPETSRRSLSRPLGYQSLESRQVLSAMAVLEAGVLTLTADDQPNEIAVRTLSLIHI